MSPLANSEDPDEIFIRVCTVCSDKIHHCLAFQTPTAGSDIYKGSLFPHTIRD